MRTVLFICTGNFYRSRLAAILFNYYRNQTGLEWEAISRGLAVGGNLKGLSSSAGQYLERRGLGEIFDDRDDPEAISIDDLEKAELIIAMDRREHELLLKNRFGQIPRILEQSGKLRYWNVGDLPPQLNLMDRVFNRSEPRDVASEACGTEHIDCAVRCLIQELASAESAPSQGEEMKMNG